MIWVRGIPSCVSRSAGQQVSDEAGNATTYGYDGLDRLSSVDVRDSSGVLTASRAYGYDGASNRTSVIGSGVVDERYAYDEANQLCWRAPASTPLRACADQPAGQTRYAYDANGNETSRGMAYNVRNVMTSVTPLGGVAGALSYFGTDADELVGDAGATLQNNALGVAARVAGSTTTLYTRDTSGGLVAERVGSTTRYPLRDALGSTIALTDSSGAKIAGSDVDYDPFGTVTSAPTVTSRVGFAGGYVPAAGGSTGLVHFGKRYYDPQTGRWTQQDEIDQPSDLAQANRYLYTGDDPLNFVDPSGKGICSTLGIGHVCRAAARGGQKLAGAGCSVASAVAGIHAGRVLTKGAVGAGSLLCGSAVSAEPVGAGSGACFVAGELSGGPGVGTFAGAVCDSLVNPDTAR